MGMRVGHTAVSGTRTVVSILLDEFSIVMETRLSADVYKVGGLTVVAVFTLF